MTENEFVVEFAYRLGQLSGLMKDNNSKDVLIVGKPNPSYEAAIEDALVTE